MELLLGTGEVARLCGVAEATIKRWADEGAFPCVRTVGGHRRFRAEEVRRFLVARGYGAPPGLGATAAAGEPDPEGVALYALNDEFERVVDRFVERAARPGSTGSEAILRTLANLGLPLDLIHDRVVVPALRRLRSQAGAGQLGPVAHDVALAQVEEAVVRLPVQVPRQARRGRAVLVGALAPNPPTIVVRLAATLLDADGWAVAASPGGAPPSAFLDYLRQHRPELFCLVIGGVGKAALLREQAALLHGACRECRAPMLVLGEDIARLSPEPPADRIVPDLRSLLEASREL